MKKLLILFFSVIGVAVIIIGYWYFSKTFIFSCYDCGKAGWQSMDGTNKCEEGFSFTKEGVKKCFMNFSWSGVELYTSVDEIKEGYIKIGGSDISSDVFTDGSIKAFIYYPWAVDEDGKLYLLSQLG